MKEINVKLVIIFIISKLQSLICAETVCMYISVYTYVYTMLSYKIFSNTHLLNGNP